MVAGTSRLRENLGRICSLRWLRVVISGGLVAFLLSRIPLAEVGGHILRANLAYLLLAFAIILFGVALGSLKWQVLLICQGIGISLRHLIAVYSIGMFFNNLLPTIVGGDVARTMVIARETGKTTKVAMSILMERATGLAALLCYAMLGLGYVAIFPPDTGLARLGGKYHVLVAISVLLTLLLLLVSMIGRLAAPGRNVLQFLKLERLALPILEALASYGNQPGALSAALGISLLFQLMAISARYCVALSLGLHLPYCILTAIRSYDCCRHHAAYINKWDWYP